ncbi:MAG: amino acid permease [Bryobacteraceae bacterium]|nr:amino acid permease [Bryobacteraceae bacterium]
MNSRDQDDLQKFGYAQELLREMGGFSNFAISFSNISILTGAVTLFGYGFDQGGPLEMSLAWPLATLLTLTVAASMAELCSAFPTSGALYHWAAALGGPRIAWLTAALNVVACIASFAAIDYGCAQYLLPLVRIEPTTGALFAAFAVIALSQGWLNAYGVGLVAKLNDASVTVHILGTLVLVGLIFWAAPLQPVSFLWTAMSPIGTKPYAAAFTLGLLQAMWTFTGYDASAHLAEETLDPRRHAPWGMFLSVALSGVIGYLMLIALTLSVKDLSPNQSAVSILQGALGERMGSALSAMAGVAMWFCGLSVLANNSRALFSLARDEGTPWPRTLAKVDSRHGTPVVAIWGLVAAAVALLVWSATVAILAAVSTVACYLAYGIPIYLGWRARASGWVREAPWNLGRWGGAVNLAALLWTSAICVILMLPPNELAAKTLAGVLVLLALIYYSGALRTYQGPAFARRKV